MKLKRHLLLRRKAMTNLDSMLKSRDITLPTEVQSSQSYGVSNSHVWMWELDCEESWAPKNWCFWTVVLEKTFESLLDCKEIQPVHPKGYIHWKDWRWSWNANTLATWCEELTHLERPFWERLRTEEKGMTQDEMVGWHHWLRTWIWASSGSWWRTGKLAMLQSMGSQRVGQDWVTELNWNKRDSLLNIKILIK